VPPVHIAVLPGAGAYPDLLDFLRTLRSPPTSLVLVSGPSKTADIEQTLAYGVHGPKRLVVVAIR
jgi:L-lactate dehydrogenase complex protein LldG